MMQPQDSLQHFKLMLQHSGLWSIGQIDVFQTWQVFKDFARLHIENSKRNRDYIGWQGGGNPSGKFEFYFSRQITSVEQEDEGEDLRYEDVYEIYCEFAFQPTHCFPKVEYETSDSSQFDDLEQFFALVESQPAFQIACQLKPLRCDVSQDVTRFWPD